MIQPVPELPTEIGDAINNNNLAIFIGAGVSRLIGCSSWAELAENLINKCFNTRIKREKRCINEKQKEVLLESEDYRKVISICYAILKKVDEELFFEELEESLLKDHEIEDHNIYTEVYNLLHGTIDECSGIFITTNADEHFDKHFKESRDIIFKPDEFRISDIGKIKLYHIHGSISDRKTLVFTIDQYFKRYNHEIFINVLREIFAKYVILFIGYGLEEFEIIDFLFTKMGLEDREEEKIELKNFLLKGYKSENTHNFEFDNLYYNTLGITVLGYNMDEKDYNQLCDVLIGWNYDINNLESRSYVSYEDMLGVIEEHEKLRR